MATTTNYSWTTPDDTDLVKDGAAAIRTLGSSADTTVKALNPGTTAGDVDYYTTSTAKARLAIGTAGQVLTVNSGATAPEWALAASGLTKITSATVSAVSSLTIDSIFSSTYKRYILCYTFESSTNGVDLRLQLRYGATTLTSNDYRCFGARIDRTNATTYYSADQANGFAVIDDGMRASGDSSTGTVNFSQVGNSSQSARIYGHGFTADAISYNQFALMTSVSQTFTGIVLSPASGTITGNYSIYGLAD